MYATQLRSTDTISGVMPVKVSSAPNSVSALQSSGLRWNREFMLSDAAVPGNLPLRTNAASDKINENAGSPISMLTAQTGNNAPKNLADLIAVVVRAHGIVTTAGPAAGRALVSTARAASQGSKRELKAIATAGSSAAALQIVSPSAGEVLGMPGVQVSLTAATQPRGATQNLPTEECGTANPSSPSPKHDRSSALAGTTKDAPAKSVAAAVDGLASGAAKNVDPAAASQSTSEQRAASAPAGETTISSFANTPLPSSVANASPMSQAVAVSAASQTMSANHTVSSAQANIEMTATNAPVSTEISGIHFVPSGPTQLDVGVMDGTHGWLRIRAELGAGGAVNASLTGSTLAHESLKAALPEMANYLGSEAVNVSKIVVHRFSEGPNSTPSSMSEWQPNGNAPGHRSGSGEARDGNATQEKNTAAVDQVATRSASTADNVVAGSDAAEEDCRLPWPFGPGGNGSWLNVSA